MVVSADDDTGCPVAVRGVGERGRCVAGADLEAPVQVGTGEGELAVEVTAICQLLAGERDRPAAVGTAMAKPDVAGMTCTTTRWVWRCVASSNARSSAGSSSEPLRIPTITGLSADGCRTGRLTG